MDWGECLIGYNNKKFKEVNKMEYDNIILLAKKSNYKKINDNEK